MTSAGAADKPEIYPKRYFDASQTWFAWNKLTAADVFVLREENGFEGQGIYFWLNHPVQFVRLVGMVVHIELVAYGRFTLITLDDYSGVGIELKLERRSLTFGADAEYSSNTTVDNIDVDVRFGDAVVYLNKTPLEVGSIVIARGTIVQFNRQRQLLLKRLALVKDTNEEAMHWSEVASWKKDVLAHPWTLTQQARREIDADIQKTELKERKRETKKLRKRAKQMEKDERDERKRLLLQEEFDADALKGSNLLPGDFQTFRD